MNISGFYHKYFFHRHKTNFPNQISNSFPFYNTSFKRKKTFAVPKHYLCSRLHPLSQGLEFAPVKVKWGMGQRCYQYWFLKAPELEYKVRPGQAQEERGEGWLEMRIYFNPMTREMMEMLVLNSKSGLIVQGIELRGQNKLHRLYIYKIVEVNNFS